HHGHTQLLFLVSRSMIVHFITPGGNRNAALPCNWVLSTFACSLRSPGLCCKVIRHPLLVTVPTPVKIVPPQQKRYWQVMELNSRTMLGLLSSCRQTSNAV